MRCISLWQPWATLCCLSHPDDEHDDLKRAVKGFETRSWSTKYIGHLLIHAAKRYTREQREAFLWPLIRETLIANGFGSPDDLAYGAIIGRVNLVGCHPSRPIRQIVDDYALAMGNYDDGRYAWEINAPILLDVPIAYRGQQGFFEVDVSAIPALRSTKIGPLFQGWK